MLNQIEPTLSSIDQQHQIITKIIASLEDQSNQYQTNIVNNIKSHHVPAYLAIQQQLEILRDFDRCIHVIRLRLSVNRLFWGAVPVAQKCNDFIGQLPADDQTTLSTYLQSVMAARQKAY